jgi:hypothetical protein
MTDKPIPNKVNLPKPPKLDATQMQKMMEQAKRTAPSKEMMQKVEQEIEKLKKQNKL